MIKKECPFLLDIAKFKSRRGLNELDQILEGLVEYELSTSELEKKGFSREEIKKVENLLYVSEYKRRQSAPGVKISLRNFGRDRRYPITNKFRDKIE